MTEDDPVLRMRKYQRGAFSEAMAVGWLLKEGYQVFVQFGVNSVDLVAYRTHDQRLVRVEVKTAKRHMVKRDGEERFYWTLREAQMDHADMLIVVTDDGRAFDATDVTSPVSAGEIGAPVGKQAHHERLGILDEHGNKR